MDFEKYLGVKPNMKQIFLKVKESPFKVGDIRLLPKGTFVWSIDLQSMVSFENDEIIEVTSNTWNGEYFFGKLKTEMGLTTIPSLIDKSGKSEIGTTFEKTKEYNLPKPIIFKYNEKSI